LDLTVNLFILNIKIKRETQPRISTKAKHLLLQTLTAFHMVTIW